MRIPKPRPIPEDTPIGNITENLGLIVDGVNLQSTIEKTISATIIKELSHPVPIKLDVSSEKIIDNIRQQFFELIRQELNRYGKQIHQELSDQSEKTLDKIRHNKGVWLSNKIFWFWLFATSIMFPVCILYIRLLIKDSL